MANKKTTLSKDIKTAWIDGCKDLVGWLSSFGKPKTNPALEKEMKYAMYRKPTKAERARVKGRYKADDPTTKDINEAWIGGKAPKRKKKS